MGEQIITRCPRCGGKVTWDASSPHRPFCSERCHMIDLGAWLSEEHSIPGEEATVPSEDKQSFTEN